MTTASQAVARIREALESAALMPSEQAAFEGWAESVCPSGDVDDVQRQWLASCAYEDWLADQGIAADADDLRAILDDIAAKDREIEGLRVDAERYRWLRECDWFTSPLCVLRNPKEVFTRGNALGADCPSRDRLDTAIDTAARAALAAAPGGEGAKG